MHPERILHNLFSGACLLTHEDSDIFLLIFWLIAFALLATLVAIVFAYAGDYYYYSDADLEITYAWASCQAAAAGLGGVEL